MRRHEIANVPAGIVRCPGSVSPRMANVPVDEPWSGPEIITPSLVTARPQPLQAIARPARSENAPGQPDDAENLMRI
jgi:hypothetical protein